MGKTGCFITANGSEDGKINPEGLSNYKVPEPMLFVGPQAAALNSNFVEADDYVEDVSPTEEELSEDIDDTPLEDNEQE